MGCTHLSPPLFPDPKPPSSWHNKICAPPPRSPSLFLLSPASVQRPCLKACVLPRRGYLLPSHVTPTTSCDLHNHQNFPLRSEKAYFWFPKRVRQNKLLVCSSASAAGSSSSDADLNPYEVLGVKPVEGYDKVKQVYTRKRKEAESVGDQLTVARLERAYDRLMMQQLANRQMGLSYGSFKVTKETKYADKQPIVPWGPRFARSSLKDIRINLAIAAAFTAWVVIKPNFGYKPLQFLAFAFVYRIFEKLKAFESPVSPKYTEDGEDIGKTMRMGKRLLRSLVLVFGSIAFASLGYTGILNLIEYTGRYIPVFLYNNQELLVTCASAVILYIMASYYR